MSTSCASTQQPNRPWLAIAGSGLVFIGVLVALTFISEPPMTVVPRPKPLTPRASRAAVAIRDFAGPYQQWGSLMFAFPVLRQGYSRLTYINQRSERDQEARLLRALKTSLTQYEYTDLFLLAHGSNRYINLIKTNLPARLTRKLRLVYNTGCGNAKQGPRWQTMGVEAYVGHGGGISVSPVFFFYFLRRWIQGYTLKRAIHEANWYTRHHLLLVGRASFGWLHGPTLVGHTKAQLFGNSLLHIHPPEQPPLLSQASNPTHVTTESGPYAPRPIALLPH